MEPRIQYAKTSDGMSIAYYAMGEGKPLVRAAEPYLSHLSVAWQIPWLRANTESLAESLQVVRYDPRGTGLSQREHLDFSLEARLLDVDAVVEKVGLERFALIGAGHGAPVAIAYAARRVERVTHLILQAPYTRGAQYYNENPARRFTSSFSDEMVREQWEFVTQAFANRSLSDPARAAEFARLMQAAMTPQAFLAFRETVPGIDVSGLLPKIVAPTLVLQDGEVRAGHFSREIAAAIPNAHLVVTQPNQPVAPIILEFMGMATDSAASPAALTAGGLVTVLFTDLTSSTALTQRLGDAKAQELVRAHNAIVREALAAQGGTEIKHTGDGIMASFPSASSALACAVAIQRAVAGRPDEQLRVHVGLNAGEPVAEEGDLFGTAVQLARRICDHAQAGQILVPDAVRHLVRGKEFLFADSGDVALKGFEDPVRLYEVRWREEA